MQDAILIDTVNMLEIWEKYKRLSYQFAQPYMKTYPEQREDIEQQCYLAMTEAVKKYDPEKGSFTNLLHFCVQNECGRYARRNAYPFSLPERTFKDETNIAAKNARITRSLSEPVKGTDGLTIADCVADDRDCIEDVTDRISREELHEDIERLLLSLSERERKIFNMHFYEGYTYKQVGNSLGVSGARVGFILRRGAKKLRNRAARNRAFGEYLDGHTMDTQTYSRATRGGLQSFLRTWDSSTESAAIDRIETERRYRAVSLTGQV